MKKLNKLLIVLFFLLTSAHCFAKNYVFFVHGLASNSKSTFSNMEQSLKYASAKYSKDDYEYAYYNYGTGDDSLNTHDFADGLDEYMDNYLLDKGFNEDKDKISIIAHSQGGIVSLIWLNNSFNKQYRNNYSKNIDTYITLASPIWGTSIVIVPLQTVLQKFFGNIEIREMLWDSETVRLVRDEFSPHGSEFRKFLASKNVVNIGSNAKGYPNVGGFSRYLDDDIAVPITSSNMNHFYVDDRDTIYEDEELIDELQYNQVSKFYVTKALHTTISKGVWRFAQGIAKLPKSCKTDEYCNHNSFEYIWKSLFKIPVKQLDEKIDKKTNSFVIDIELELDSTDITPDDFEFNFKSASGRSIASKELRVKRIYDRDNDQYYRSNGKSLSFVYAGRLLKAKNNKYTKELIMTIRNKGNRFLSKKFKLKVRPQHSTVVRTSLIRFKDYLAANQE